MKKEKIFNKYFQKKGLNYGGQNVFPAFQEYFNYLFKIRFLWLAYYVNSYDNLFKKNKIKAVVVMDDLIPVNRALILIAKKYNIPSIVVPHGVFIDTAGKGFIPLTADKMAVWGKIIKNQMINFGVNSKKLIITGASIFDDIVQKQKNNKNQFKENKKKKFSLMLGIQKYDDVFADKETEKIIKIAIESVQEFKDVELKISLHPRLSSNIIKSILKEKKGNICIEKGKIEDLIKECDGLITLYSTIAFDAMFENKPIISLNPLNRPEIIPYVKSGVALKARNKKELINAIKKIRSEKFLNEWVKNKEKFLKNYLFKLDGKSSERVLNAIKEIMLK
ncbi:MAG: CDP-glycerol glycerophosphotransferase family protein [Nanoarchaeota archaeon]|nr:CDP-glycerol glycerophosphotransferase family protein [Nanoarchaeota archaeon]